MYAEQTSLDRFAIYELTFEEAQIIIQALIELKGKLKEHENFVHEVKLAEIIYKKLDRELINSREVG